MNKICTRYMITQKLELRKNNNKCARCYCIDSAGELFVCIINRTIFNVVLFVQYAVDFFLLQTWNSSELDAGQASGGVRHSRQLFLFFIIIM